MCSRATRLLCEAGAPRPCWPPAPSRLVQPRAPRGTTAVHSENMYKALGTWGSGLPGGLKTHPRAPPSERGWRSPPPVSPDSPPVSGLGSQLPHAAGRQG